MYNLKNGKFRMPLKRTYSTSTSIVPTGYQQTKKRKVSSKSKLFKSGRGTIGRPMPFPTRMVAKLKYAETSALQSAIVPVAALFFSTNSIYDPNRSGTGHQPYGHDTYATIYNQYTVLNSKIKFNISNNTGVLFAVTWGGGIDDDVATTPAYDTWRERPTYKSEMLTINAGLGQKPQMLYWDRNKRFPQYDTYQSLSAPFGASPAEEEFFSIVVQSAASGVSIGTIYISVEIEYTVELYELKDLGSS